MTELGFLDLLSPFWQEKRKIAAGEGRHHGRDYVCASFIPDLGDSVTSITPGNIPLGRLAVVGGRTGSNKTRVLWNLAADIVMQGVAVGFLTLEIDAEEASPSIDSIITQVPQRFITAGRHYDASKAAAAAEAIRSGRESGTLGRFFSNEHTDDIPDAAAALAWMYELHATHDVRVFCLDYFQILSASSDARKFAELQDAAKELQLFVKATKSLLIVASQLNRGNALPKVRPRAEGLDSCPALERAAHFVWLLDHTREEDEDHVRRTWLMIAKNRHGRQGIDVPLEFNYRHHGVRQAAPDEESRWPT